MILRRVYKMSLLRHPVGIGILWSTLPVIGNLSDWKPLANRSGSMKLYDSAVDIQEQNDMAEANPAKTDELHAKLVEWESEMDVTTDSGVQSFSLPFVGVHCLVEIARLKLLG